MPFVISETNVFIDESLNNSTSYLFSCFDGLEKLLHENFYYFFLHESKTDSVFNKINEIKAKYMFDDPQSTHEFDKLNDVLTSSFTSFSWGYDELELIFIIFTENDNIFLNHAQSLTGLLIHETLHSIERQRGLEDDLKRSLAISINTFEEFAEMLSQTKFTKEELVKLFREIGEIAIYVLKDLYVDREAIERGFGAEILEQYKATFNLQDNFEDHKLPEISLDLHSIDISNLDLKEFKQAFIVVLGLVPSWLPFIRISKGIEKEQALEIRKFINSTYEKVSIISERFHHLENTYLTEFAFTKSFHVKWFSEIFSIVIDLLSGGEFIIWQFSRLVIDIEEYKKNNILDDESQSTYSVQELILVPILKAAFLFSKNHPTIQNVNSEILSKLQNYISEEDMEEWENYYEEYSIESLLIFVLSELIRMLREKFLDSIQNLKVYTGFILSTLQILIDIKEDMEYLSEYHLIKNLIHQFITKRDSRFLSLKILYPLEFRIEQLMFEDEPPFTPEQADEFLHIARFYNIPKLNWVLDISKRFAGIMKISLQKASENNESLGLDVIGLSMLALTKDYEEISNPDLLIPIARSALMALKVPVVLMKEIVNFYGNLLSG